MAPNITATYCDGWMLNALIGAGRDALALNVDIVNRMNVFPAPDGDTGTNTVTVAAGGGNVTAGTTSFQRAAN